MRFLILALLGGLVLGCSASERPLTKVTGLVTLDGKPIADAVITFVSNSGGIACSGSTDSSGKYIIGCQYGPGAPPGVYAVKIKSREVAKKGTNPMEGLTPGTPEYNAAYQKVMAAGPNRSGYQDKSEGAIPEKYNSGTELTAEVGTSSTTIDFPLVSK